MFAPVAQRRLQRLALAIQTVGAATAGFVVGYLYGKGLDPTSKPQQPSESHGWFGSPHGGSQEVWTHSPDGNSISLRIEGEDLPPTPPPSDPELARWEPGQPSAPMPAMPRHTGILFTPPETWERVPEEEMTEGRVYGNMQPMPKPGTGRILVYPHTDGEEHLLSAHWEGEHVDERTPKRGTTVEGYAPAVLMWAHATGLTHPSQTAVPVGTSHRRSISHELPGLPRSPERLNQFGPDLVGETDGHRHPHIFRCCDDR